MFWSAWDLRRVIGSLTGEPGRTLSQGDTGSGIASGYVCDMDMGIGTRASGKAAAL